MRSLQLWKQAPADHHRTQELQCFVQSLWVLTTKLHCRLSEKPTQKLYTGAFTPFNRWLTLPHIAQVVLFLRVPCHFRHTLLVTGSAPRTGTLKQERGFQAAEWSTTHLPRQDANDVGSIPELDDPLEEEMATHSSVLAWEIPRIEPEEIPHDRRQGSQRAGHDCTHKYTHAQKL